MSNGYIIIIDTRYSYLIAEANQFWMSLKSHERKACSNVIQNYSRKILQFADFNVMQLLLQNRSSCTMFIIKFKTARTYHTGCMYVAFVVVGYSLQ